MFRSSGTPESVRKREGLPHGGETAASGFKSRLVHFGWRPTPVIG